MMQQMTADDILPLIAGLTPQERLRLIRLVTRQSHASEGLAYETAAPHPDEFSSDDESLAWEAEGWEEFA